MRVLILSPSVYPVPGGLQRYTYYLAVSLARAGHQVDLFSLALQEPPPLEDNLNFFTLDQWRTIPNKMAAKAWKNVSLFMTLHRLIRDTRPDQLICTWWDPLGYFAVLLGMVLDVPVTSVGHGQEIVRLPAGRYRGALKRYLRRLTFQKSRWVIAVSRFTRDHVLALGVKPERVRVVPNGLTPEYLQQSSICLSRTCRAQLNLDGYVILQVGRLVPRKGHQLVLEALHELQENVGNSFTYVIVGEGPHQTAIKDETHALGLDGVVRLVGYIPDEELHKYYCASDVVVMVSHNPEDAGDIEGFGIVYLEAYAHGRPVIGTASGGIPDAIIDGETGLLVQPGDIHGLVLAIRELSDRQVARRMGKKGKDLVETFWNWEHLGATIVNLIVKRS